MPGGPQDLGGGVGEWLPPHLPGAALPSIASPSYPSPHPPIPRRYLPNGRHSQRSLLHVGQAAILQVPSLHPLLSQNTMLDVGVPVGVQHSRGSAVLVTQDKPEALFTCTSHIQVAGLGPARQGSKRIPSVCLPGLWAPGCSQAHCLLSSYSIVTGTLAGHTLGPLPPWAPGRVQTCTGSSVC